MRRLEFVVVRVIVVRVVGIVRGWIWVYVIVGWVFGFVDGKSCRV